VARAASRLGVRSVRVVPGWMQLTVIPCRPSWHRQGLGHVHKGGVPRSTAEIAGVAGVWRH